MEIINPDLVAGNIIMSRVRLARNLKDLPFTLDPATAKEVVKKVNRALVKADTFNLYFVSNLDDIALEAMKERHLISQNLIENRESGAALINGDESLSIMVNEEDVIREQCFMKGLSLSEAYKRLNAIDDELAKSLDFAFDDDLGYLTACPTNLGTGMRASVMMFLPALTESGEINGLIEEVSALGLTVRGLYGEGSKAEGCIYQISNEVTLGISEYDIIRSVEQTVMSICRVERETEEKLYVNEELVTMDRARKAYGVLTNAVLLPYKEYLSLIAEVKLGAMLGMINIFDTAALDDLTISVRPANLCVQYGRPLNETDRDLFRAELVGKKLIKLKE
ncbi:MAG: ATP--guanido phosphotransferase [Clostridia bacterium]|nr:ATP--guanido phosphotransferase [Clostridia bacterium]